MDRLGQGLKLFAEEGRRLFLEHLKARYGERWAEAYAEALGDKRRDNFLEDLRRGRAPEEAVDLTHFKDLLLGHKDLFKDLLGRSFQRAVTWADEIAEVRNDWAHQKEVSEEDVRRALDNMARFLEAMDGREEVVAELKALRDGRLPTLPLPPGDLPPWWQVAQPHADIRRGEFDESTFAAKLDDVVRGTASPEYRYADEFFRKTYLTRDLRRLLQDVLKRLAGQGGEAVVQLRTPFGGGKTHALIALYHLVKDAATSGALPEIRALLQEAGLPDIPRARVAVLVGTDLSPLGREAEEGVRIHTLWGELAYALGGLEGYALVREADEARTAPGKALLSRLIRSYTPLLVLMDELLVYQVKAGGVAVGATTLQAQTFAFLQELTEVIGSTPQAALVTTFPESHLEYYHQEGALEAFQRLERIFGRVQAVRVPVQGEEIYEILRRRLFERIDEKVARQVALRYAEHYRGLEGVPEEARSPRYAELLQKAYPFHPELVRTLYERWGTLQGFQRTRGVLRLLARIVEENHRSPIARPLIGLGDVHLEHPDLRATVVSVLQEANWEAVIASDIVGKAAQLDREVGGEYARLRLAQSVATAIFMYTHSGGARPGISKPLLDLSLAYPEGITPALVSDALDKLRGRLFYLYEEGGAYTFKAQPNLNAVLAEKIDQVEERSVRERLRAHLERVLGSGLLKPVVWPVEHREVPDDRTLKLVLYSPDHPAGSEEGERLRRVIQQNAAGSPRVYKNTLLHLHPKAEALPRLLREVRTELALEAIRGSGLPLSEPQRRELEGRLRALQEELPRRVLAAYTELYAPQDGHGTFRYRFIQPQVQTASSLVGALVDYLKHEEGLLEKLDPGLLLRRELWPEEEPLLRLDLLRDYFYRLPGLPLLASDEVLRRAVAEGVRLGLFELGLRGEGEAWARVWRASSPPRPEEVHFGERYLLARLGVLPPPPSPEPPAEEKKEGELPVSEDGGKVPLPPPTPTQVRKVGIVLETLPVEKVPVLVDLVAALRDAGGQVRIRVELQAENPEGLKKDVLELTVKELLLQHGLTHKWED